MKPYRAAKRPDAARTDSGSEWQRTEAAGDQEPCQGANAQRGHSKDVDRYEFTR